jgi:hypothetical protein
MSSRRWITNLRVERRRGAVRYVIAFTDGVTRASLFGTLHSFTNCLADQEREAWECAVDWLAHIQPVPQAPKRSYQRIYFPVNRERRKYKGSGRSKAA